MLSTDPLLETSLEGLSLNRRGKVRDIYEIAPASGEPALLIVATNGVWAFDYVLGTSIPDKGKVLTQLSGFLVRARSAISCRTISSRSTSNSFRNRHGKRRDVLRGRTMLARRTDPIPIECVARGYLSGTGWKEYQQTGSVCGVRLPLRSARIGPTLRRRSSPPASKADSGHDVNITEEEAGRLVGTDLIARLKSLTLKICRRGTEHAESKGIIIADTKFEFGMVGAGNPATKSADR